MTIFIDIIIPILSLLLGGGLATILTINAVKKKAEGEATSVDASNSLTIVDIQAKYIDLIDDKDKKIRELQDELVKLTQKSTSYYMVRCDVLNCPNRKPPFGVEMFMDAEMNEKCKGCEIHSESL